MHTPGPWTHKKDERLNDFDDPGRSWNARLIWSPGYGNIAHSMLWHNDDGESEDNARLIAAAPDLLEACRKTQFVLDRYNEKGLLTNTMRYALEMVSAAIAKAEGKDN